ncbi:MAG: TRAP-type C4-dicarboxylate transport system, substrate-binding protein [Myxococcales bacterium]|nr:TRAP-type C4-dicarboxylate transport system, substrate-binding protein [Myxococcales bacterium]
MIRALVAVALVCASVATASAQSETVLRLATNAPAGTAWAREFAAFAREVEAGTKGQVRIKWYLGGIAGDEKQMGERVRKGQLDGAASGGPLCEQLAPSMRVMRVVGLVTSMREAGYVASRLWPIFEAEFKRSGMMPLGTATIGPHILFSREPVRSMADFRRGRYWVWDRDDILRQELASFGVQLVPLPIAEAEDAYVDGRIDGFLAPASVALAFQWSTHARYVTNLKLDYLTGCVFIADRAVDPLPVAAREVLRTASNKLGVRFTGVGAETDVALLGGLFQRQGLKVIPVDPRFATEFFELARATRERLGEALVPSSLLGRVLALLADLRGQQTPLEPTSRRR